MRHFPRWLSIATLSISVAANPLYAQEPEKTDDAAHILFDAGAKAYAAGLYSDAVSAFREAYKLAPDRPTVLFSLAQAERRQYTVKQDPAMLETAIAHFRRYIELVAEGGRRGDAVVALGELEALRAGTEAPTEKAARIFITTETSTAVIFVDGKKFNQVPVIEEVGPGKHEIRIEAPGFVTETREIVAVAGTIFPLEINLQEKPSFLQIKAPTGASITVDGRVYGDAPLQSPLELASGSHRLVVMRRGYVPYDERISIERAWTTSLNVALKSTNQRRLSYFLFGTSMAGFGIGTALTITAIVKDTEAAEIYAKAQKGNIDRDMLMRYSSALDSRNLLAGASVGTILFAVGVGVTTGVTYWFDSSSHVPAGSGRQEARISVTPLAGGGFVSVGSAF
jgi:tetratricopeptide (TPR) repeat protein